MVKKRISKGTPAAQGTDPEKDPFVWLAQALGLAPANQEARPKSHALRQTTVRPVITNTGGIRGRAIRSTTLDVGPSARATSRKKRKR